MRHAWADAREGKSRSPRLDPSIPLARVLFVGGGGCGKSRLIVRVLTPLFEAFYGPAGCVRLAPSNKAARLIGGRTMHAAQGLTPASSLRTAALRLTGMARKKVEQVMIPAGAVVCDEFSQIQSPMLHATALRSTYARASHYSLNVGDYTNQTELFGRIGILAIFGDHLQLPPVPKSVGLLACLEHASQEHKAGAAMFANIQHVYLFEKMMRYSDPILINILATMRTAGGGKLTDNEW